MSYADSYGYDKYNDDYKQSAYKSSMQANAFACACFIIGFVTFVAGAFYLSPVSTGSPNERKTLCAPHDISAT